MADTGMRGTLCDLRTSPFLPSVRARLHTRQHTFEEMKVMDLDEFASVAARTGGGNPFVARRLLGQALEEEEEKTTKEGMTEDEARAYEIMVSPTWSSRGGPRGEDGIAFVRFVRSFNGIGCQRKLLFQTAVHEQTFDLLRGVNRLGGHEAQHGVPRLRGVLCIAGFHRSLSKAASSWAVLFVLFFQVMSTALARARCRCCITAHRGGVLRSLTFNLGY